MKDAIRIRNLILVCLVATLTAAAPSMAQTAPKNAEPNPVRNPIALRATEMLSRRPTGSPPQVRFEWDPVPGASQYWLRGIWTDAMTWTLKFQEVRITPDNALEWQANRVAVELSLATGTHSWQVVALFGQNAVGDFARPTQVSFDLNR